MPVNDGSGDSDSETTHTVSIRLPVELVDRADIVASVQGVPRRRLVEESIRKALSAREQDSQYRSHYRAACNRGDISFETLVAALGERPYETSGDGEEIDEGRIEQLVSGVEIGNHVLSDEENGDTDE